MPLHLPQAPPPSEPWEQPTTGNGNISYSFFFKGDTYTEWNCSTNSSEAVAPPDGGSVQRPYGKKAAGFNGLPANLDAVVPHWKDGTTIYCFKGNHYWKFDTLGNKVERGFAPNGHPYGNTSDFPGVPAGLDAAVSHPSDGKSVYFFKNTEYWKYDMAVGAVVHGYPKPYGGSTGLWPGIPASVDAAMPHWNDGFSIFLLQGRSGIQVQH